MKAFLINISILLSCKIVLAQNDTLTPNLSGCWVMQEIITSSGNFERYGTFQIRIDSLNNLWQQSGEGEVRKSSLMIKEKYAFFNWPYREKYRVKHLTDTSFTLILFIEDVISEEEYNQMPYPRGPRSTSITVKYKFIRKTCK